MLSVLQLLLLLRCTSDCFIEAASNALLCVPCRLHGGVLLGGRPFQTLNPLGFVRFTH